MNKIRIHEIVATHFDDHPEEVIELLPEDIAIDCNKDIDPTCLFVTAAVVLSGIESNSLDDIKDGCIHFASLLSCGVITVDDLVEETQSVLDELMEWGDRVTGQYN